VEFPAASAATVFAGYCQSGASAQGIEGGFSIVNPEAFCNHIRMAAVAKEAYMFAEQTGNKKAASAFYDMYIDNLEDANGLLENTEDVSQLDTFFGYLVRPLAVIGALVFLL